MLQQQFWKFLAPCLVLTAHLLLRPAQHPKSDLCRFIVEDSRSHTIRHTHTHTHIKPVLLLWTSDQLVSETPTQCTSNTRDEHPSRQWDTNPHSQQSSGLHCTPTNSLSQSANLRFSVHAAPVSLSTQACGAESVDIPVHHTNIIFHEYL